MEFDRCYQAYRGILLGFNPAPLTRIAGIDELLAVCAQQGVKCGGVPLFDLWARGRNRRYDQAKRAKFAKIVLRASRIECHELLPENRYPPVVENERDEGVAGKSRRQRKPELRQIGNGTLTPCPHILLKAFPHSDTVAKRPGHDPPALAGTRNAKAV